MIDKLKLITEKYIESNKDNPDELKKYKNKDYLVIIDNNEYILDEEIIIEYRLVKNKEIENSLLFEILSDLDIYEYHKRNPQS